MSFKPVTRLTPYLFATVVFFCAAIMADPNRTRLSETSHYAMVGEQLSGSKEWETATVMNASVNCDAGVVIPGVNICIEKNSQITIVDGNYVISPVLQSNCPSGTVKLSSDPTVCANDDYVLQLVDGQATLVEKPCSENEVGCIICGHQGIDPPPPGPPPECCVGLMRVDGYPLCVSNDIALNTSDSVNFGIEPGTEKCEHGRVRINEGGFCVPPLPNCDPNLPSDVNSLIVCKQSISDNNKPNLLFEEAFLCTQSLGGGRIVPHCLSKGSMQ